MSKCYFCEQNKQVTWIFRLKDDRVRKSHKQFLEQVKPRIKPPLLSIPKDSLDGYYNCSGEYIFKKMNNENKLPEVGKIYVLKTCKLPFVLKEIKSSGNQHQLESEATRTHEQKQQGKGRFIVKNNSIREFWKMFEELPDQEPTEESSKETSDNAQEALEQLQKRVEKLELLCEQLTTK